MPQSKPRPVTKATGSAKQARPGPATKGAARASEGKGIPETVIDEGGQAWVRAGGKGYRLALMGERLVARNDAGKQLASVPKELSESPEAEQLLALRDWLKRHQVECAETVETWMLRSLPVPRTVLQSVWADPAWRTPLENAVVVASTPDGSADFERVGFLRGSDATKGIGIVDLDGETAWLKTPVVLIPHPILLPELNDLRGMATELGLSQGLSQLFRGTFLRGLDVNTQATTVGSYANGKFAMLMHAVGKARSLGYPVRGGFATCAVYEGGNRVQARFWIGSEAPDAETYTGDLLWVDARERTLPIGEVGPVAYSEGVRMASAIHAARVVEKQGEA